MIVEQRGWDLAPDFSAQLQAAMDYAGLTFRDVATGLRELGIGSERSGPQQVSRLLKGSRDPQTGQPKPTNPTFILIAGLARVCEVPVAWFFDDSADLEAMIERYGDRAADGQQPD